MLVIFYRLFTFVIVPCFLLACQTQGPGPVVIGSVSTKESETPTTTYQASFKRVSYDALPNWQKDNLVELWPAFLASCKVLITQAIWQDICTVAEDIDGSDNRALRHYFEAFFDPYWVSQSDGSTHGLVTGYYEPLLRGSRKKGGVYQTPLYRVPDDLLVVDLASLYPELKNKRLRGRLLGNKVVPYFSRAQLVESNLLMGQEICWVEDPIDAFFLHIQGSGRVFFPETNETIRVAYGEQNGHPYRSIGQYLVKARELKLEEASAGNIKKWVQNHPTRLNEVLNVNPSYIFFKEEAIVDHMQGPKGALGVPLTEKRSIAVDPRFIPLGVPVFIETTLPNTKVPFNRLVMAQDTGGAIRGAVRADFFWGFGDKAGALAGKMKEKGNMWVLWPKLAQTLDVLAVNPTLE